MKRREFMVKSTLSAIAIGGLKPSLPGIISAGSGHERRGQLPHSEKAIESNWANEAPSNQRMNADFISFLPGVEYFLILKKLKSV